jgi:hypothetical protein
MISDIIWKCDNFFWMFFKSMFILEKSINLIFFFVFLIDFDVLMLKIKYFF